MRQHSPTAPTAALTQRSHVTSTTTNSPNEKEYVLMYQPISHIYGNNGGTKQTWHMKHGTDTHALTDTHTHTLTGHGHRTACGLAIELTGT